MGFPGAPHRPHIPDPLHRKHAGVAGAHAGHSLAPPPNGVTVRMFNGYHVDETSPAWKQWCLPYPCTPQVKFPGYATKVIPQHSLGANVIVQLWKGRCERLFGGTAANHSFPGGVGAEVGIYRKRDASDHDWYPAPAPSSYVDYTLIYTINGQLQQPWGKTTYPPSAMLQIIHQPLNYVLA